MPDQSYKLEKLIFPFWSFSQLPKNLHLRLGTLRPMFCIRDTWGTWGTWGTWVTWGYWDTGNIEAKVVSLPTSQDMTVIISDQLTADCQKIKAFVNGSEVAHNNAQQWLTFNLLSAPLEPSGPNMLTLFWIIRIYSALFLEHTQFSPTSKTL